MANEYYSNHSLNQLHRYTVELIDRIDETMYHYSIVSKKDEVIWNQYIEVEEDRWYRTPLEETRRCLVVGYFVENTYVVDEQRVVLTSDRVQ